MRPLLILCGAIVLCDTMFFAALTPLLPEYADEFGPLEDGSRRSPGRLSPGRPRGQHPERLRGGAVRRQADGDDSAARHRRHVGIFGYADTIVVLDSRASSRASAARSRGRPRSPGYRGRASEGAGS